jgi:hypothetical protein
MFYIRMGINRKNYEFLYPTEESRQAYINKVCEFIDRDVNVLFYYGLTLDSCDDENKVIPTSQPYEEMFVMGYFAGAVEYNCPY